MTRAPAALAMVTLSFAARTIEAEPCPPRAELAGDLAAVARVRDELGRLGVTIGDATPACRRVRARVQLDERGAVVVAVIDSSGRGESRVVSDAALAAAWIDSWLHDELPADAGPPRVRVATAAAVATAAVATAAVATATVATATVLPAAVIERPPAAATARRSMLDDGALSIAYEQAFTGDGASWTGGSAAGCAELGRVCVGARLRYGHQAADASTDERTELAALATASTGFRIGRMAIGPELGLGVGRLLVQRNTTCKPVDPAICKPGDPTCTPLCIDASGNPTSGPSRWMASYQPRVAAALRIAVPLFEHVWLDAIASVTYVPFAHTDGFPGPPTAVPAGGAPADYALSGEPSASLQLSIGLRVGAP